MADSADSTWLVASVKALSTSAGAARAAAAANCLVRDPSRKRGDVLDEVPLMYT